MKALPGSGRLSFLDRSLTEVGRQVARRSRPKDGGVKADIIGPEERMRTIIELVALALIVAGCAATTPNSSAPDKSQRTQDERTQQPQGGGY